MSRFNQSSAGIRPAPRRGAAGHPPFAARARRFVFSAGLAVGLAAYLPGSFLGPERAYAAPAKAKPTALEAAAEKAAGAEKTAGEAKAAAAEAKAELGAARGESDLLWLMISAFLVFFMQAGFALVEAGFTRAKNTVNILMKNISDFLTASVAFWLVGFAVMFGPLALDGFGFGSPALASDLVDKGGKPDSWSYGFYFFQAAFCGTAATIVSGAMAERTKFGAYMIVSVAISALIYPVFGSLAWSNLFDAANKGWLAAEGFVDFAGSTVVHSIGGWIGLAGAIVLGARRGKYEDDGTVKPIFGHNMAISTLGVFILWFGWFGFNPGSTTSIKGGSFAVVAVTTNFAAAAGGLGAMLASYMLFKVTDISMTLNGVLAGLVAITAGCFNVSVVSAGIIGFAAGWVVVGGVLLLDRMRIDDPVGAVAVHGLGGLWGTLAVGLFAQKEFGGGPDGLFFGGGFDQLAIQAVGAGAAFVWSFGTGLVLFLAIKYTIGLRVTAEEEDEGLDQGEHGNEAYWSGDV